MIRAVLKGSLLFVFGRVPGGPKLYRSITRGALGTQATHVDKLNRVWPGYVKVWRDRCGLELKDATIGTYEGGWTPFPFLLAYLLTGRGGWVANHEGRMHPQYCERALEAALKLEFEGVHVPESRRALLRDLRSKNALLDEILDAIGASLYEGISADKLTVESGSTDLVHSGGVLEHLRPAQLESLTHEFFRVLKPGGICSHVFDHRDHLYHADKRYPFLNHLRFSESTYRLLLGHPLLYHSRMLPAQIRRAFEEEGFELILMRRLILPASSYVEDDAEAIAGLKGISRNQLAPQFQGASDADLHTAAAHYLFRKPG